MPSLTATLTIDDPEIWAAYIAALEAVEKVVIISRDDTNQTVSFTVPIE